MSKTHSEVKYMALGHLARAGGTGGTRVRVHAPRLRAPPCVHAASPPALAGLGETVLASGESTRRPLPGDRRGWSPDVIRQEVPARASAGYLPDTSRASSRSAGLT